MESKLKILELIQGIVNRMSSNSFTLKGWAVTLVAAIFVLSSDDVDKEYFVLLVLIPILMFWILDAYYLMKERAYIKLYNKTRTIEPERIDFELATEQSSFCDYIKSFFSVAEILFYIPMTVIVTIIICIVLRGWSMSIQILKNIQ